MAAAGLSQARDLMLLNVGDRRRKMILQFVKNKAV
jgi:hypothetical protein